MCVLQSPSSFSCLWFVVTPICVDAASPVKFICCYYDNTIFVSVVESSLYVAIGSIFPIPFIITDNFEDITVHDDEVPFVGASLLLLAVFGEGYVSFDLIWINA